MRYGRQADGVARPGEPLSTSSAKGWVCSHTTAHFRLDDGLPYSRSSGRPPASSL